MILKKFTKKDKRTKLEKEIDSVLDVMSSIKPDPEFDNRTNLDKEIDSVLETMSNIAPESEDYENLVGKLEKLYKAKAYDKAQLAEYSEMVENLDKLYKAKIVDKSRKISPDTRAIVLGNLLGILAILCKEKADVITSKALGFVMKGRI